MNNKKLLFVRNVNASWAIRDREILSTEFKLKDLNLKVKHYLNPSWFFEVLKSDIIFFWFASLNFLPILILGKILNKKLVTVSGGFDAAAAYGINYGAFTHSKLSQRLRRFFFNNSDKILCVSKANMAETIINSGCSAALCELVYHGFEAPIAAQDLKPWTDRKERVVMIAQCTKDTYYRKSVDDLIKLADMNPEMEFILVGRVDPDLETLLDKIAPKNFKYTGFLLFNGDEFKNLLNDSKFIIQLSFYESFGCAIIDGSLMGCYPIASSKFSLFEVVNNIGTSIDHGNLRQISNVLKNISTRDIDVVEIAKCSLEKFPVERRKEELLKTLKELS